MFQNKHGVIYDKPLTILEPSLKLLDTRVSNNDYRLKYSIGSINRNEDNSANIAYDRIIVEFKLNTHFSADAYSNICIVYDLNAKTPLFKVAAGKTLSTCLNMCIWADTDLYVTDDYHKIELKIQSYLNDLDKREQEYELFRDKLEDTILPKNKLYATLGKIIYNADNTLKAATLKATEELQNSKSDYYIADSDTTLWNVYNAITQQFSNKFSKSYVDVPSNVLELSKIIYN